MRRAEDLAEVPTLGVRRQPEFLNQLVGALRHLHPGWLERED